MRRPSEQASAPQPPGATGRAAAAPGITAESPDSSYDLSPEFDSASLDERLKGGVSLAPGSWTRVTETYFDSFDWRLHKRGTVLVEQRTGKRSDIIWRARDSGATLARMTGRRVPRFVANLPNSPLRERLGALLKARAALPAVRLESRRCITEVRDQREKMVARLIEESWQATRVPIRELPALGNRDARRHSAADSTIRRQLRLELVKGYETAARRLEKALRAPPGVAPQDTDRLSCALTEIGRFPGDTSTKLRLVFAAELRGDQVLHMILQRELDTLEASLPGLRADLACSCTIFASPSGAPGPPWANSRACCR